MSNLNIRDRRKGRELAFQVLYSLAFAINSDPDSVRQAFIRSPYLSNMVPESEIEPEKEPYAFPWELVQGVSGNVEKLDRCLEKLSHKWRPGRLGKIELTLLRLGLYEILSGQTPPRVVMNEILLMADQFGASGAKSFINGILDAASRTPGMCSLA